MTVDNGPDRSLGLWQRGCLEPARYKIEDGQCWYPSDFSESGFEAGFCGADSMLGDGLVPVDVTAKREAIRAGWREVEGKWVKDAWRWMNPYARPKAEPTPLDYEQAAKFFGEWPEDGAPAQAPEQPKRLTSYRLAKQALREACEDARRQGQEDERRKAKPCVLKRLDGTSDYARRWPAGQEGAVAIMLMNVVAQAKRSGVDLSALAERLAREA